MTTYPGLNELADECHMISVDHGWWPTQFKWAAGQEQPMKELAPRNFGELVALIHSEASAALEEYCAGHGVNFRYFAHPDGTICPADTEFECPLVASAHKPAGIPSELADILIRVLDVCGAYGIDIDSVVQEKMGYNRTRPFRHGGRQA